MAIETLILRPTSSSSGLSGSQNSYPELDSADNGYLYVNEEVADDDSTYVIVNTSSSSWNFDFTIPQSYINKIPCAIRIITRAKALTTDTQLSVSIGLITDSENTYGFESIALTDTYELYKFDTPNEKLSQAWNKLLNPEVEIGMSAPVIFGASIPASGSNKASAGTAAVTQLYLEIDFDPEATPTSEIYVKRNGAWIGTTSHFKKINGAWTEITVAEAKEIIATITN